MKSTKRQWEWMNKVVEKRFATEKDVELLGSMRNYIKNADYTLNISVVGVGTLNVLSKSYSAEIIDVVERYLRDQRLILDARLAEAMQLAEAAKKEMID